MSEQLIVAQLDLTDCPIGNVLDPRDPDQSVERRFFSHWENALTPHQYWGQDGRFRIVTDNGRTVLEHVDKSERCLLTGDDLWRDYAIEVGIRQLLPTSAPNPDDECNLIGRTGIVFRCRTLRRYYFFCIEGYDRIVLYRREDARWLALAHRWQPIDRSRYYKLKVELSGERIRCYIDGEIAFEVCDDAIPTGKCGIRTNTLARFDGIVVTMTKVAHEVFIHARDDYERELSELRKRNPKPMLWHRIDISEFYPCAVKVGFIGKPARAHLLLIHPSEQRRCKASRITRGSLVDFKANGMGNRATGFRNCITAMDLNGDVLWQNCTEHDFRFTKLCDMDGDGSEEIACINGERIIIMDGATGVIRCEESLPPAGPYVGFRNSRCAVAGLYVVNLRGEAHPSDIVIMDGTSAGGYTIWAYAYDACKQVLSLMWTMTIDQPPFGHHIHFHDIDGDGREEILAGCFLLDDDGMLLWRVDGSEYFECFQGGRHPDVVALGKFAGDDSFQAILACGSEGVFFVDARTGKVHRHHRIGHAQGLSIGNFRMDVKGLEVLVGTRWGNYGILTIFSGWGDELAQFQPDYRSQGGPPVNWRGDGQEFIFLFSSASALGLYDAFGRKVVELPDEVRGDYYGAPAPIAQDVVGDPRDELIFPTADGLFIYTQDEPVDGERIYAPVRNRRVEYPIVSYPRFVDAHQY